MPTVAHRRPCSIEVSRSTLTRWDFRDHRILITGVLTDDSLALGIAQRALEEGATIALSGAGRAASITRRTAPKLGDIGEVIELDVTNRGRDRRRGGRGRTVRFGRLDGLVHAIGYAPESCLAARGMLVAPFSDVATAMQISTYSLAALVGAFRPLLAKSTASGGASVIALDFDGTRAYPMYDWMGVMKAGLESLGRYLARESGPGSDPREHARRRTHSHHGGQVHSGFLALRGHLGRARPPGLGRARLQRRRRHGDCDALATARATSASIIHVDGGAHSMGSTCVPRLAPPPTDQLVRALRASE